MDGVGVAEPYAQPDEEHDDTGCQQVHAADSDGTQPPDPAAVQGEQGVQPACDTAGEHARTYQEDSHDTYTDGVSPLGVSTRLDGPIPTPGVPSGSAPRTSASKSARTSSTDATSPGASLCTYGHALDTQKLVTGWNWQSS